MWWCLIFDFTFSIFACFCCSFVFSFLLSSSSSSFRVFVLHIICVIRESFMFPLRMTHGQRITPFSFLLFLFFLFFAVFCCSSHANLNRDPSSDEHIIEPNWMSISVVSPSDPRSGVTRPTRALLSSAQLDVRNWPPWSFGLVWRSTDL